MYEVEYVIKSEPLPRVYRVPEDCGCKGSTPASRANNWARTKRRNLEKMGVAVTGMIVRKV